MHTRRHLLSSALQLIAISPLAYLPALARAETNFPSKPIQVLVGYPPGGPIDVGARVIMDSLYKTLGWKSIVMNKPGVGGTLAIQELLRAPADGYTLGLGLTTNIVLGPVFFPSARSTDQDALPIAQFAEQPRLIYARAGSGIATLDDLVKAMRAAPGKYAYASPGSGTTSHLTFEYFKATAKLSAVHVPFRGSVAAATAVVQGELEIGIDSFAPLIPMIQDRRLVPLAQSGERRSSTFPEVPTMLELGYKAMAANAFVGLFAPPGMEPAMVRKIEAAVMSSLKDPEVANRIRRIGLEPKFRSGPQLAEEIRRERPYWQSAIDYSGAKP